MRLSIGMMVKNEEKNLERCLQSLQPLLDAVESELIIVDTGSEDNTVGIARRYTDKIYFHDWNNNFSEMRNITIGYATGEWFLVIDADEELQDAKQIIDFLKSPNRNKFGAAAITGYNFTQSNNPDRYTVLSTIRLFKNDGFFHYEGAAHNQQVFKGKAIQLPAVLHHYGYISDEQELMDRKFNRTSLILKNELAKDPDNIYYWYQLSNTYAMHKDFDEAIECIEKAYQLLYKQPKPAEFMYVFAHRGLVYKLAGKPKKVEENCLESLTVKKGLIDIYFYLGDAQAQLGKHQEAVASYNEYLSLLAAYNQAKTRDSSIIEYTLSESESVYYNLVNLHHQLKNYEKVLEYAEKLTKEKSIREVLVHKIYAYIQLEKFQDLRQWHDVILKVEWYSFFYEKLTAIIKEVNPASSNQVAATFADMDSVYGLYSRMLLEDNQGEFTNETLQRIKNIELAYLPTYGFGIVYYLLKRHFPLDTLLINFKENQLNHIFEKLAMDYGDLSDIIYAYLQSCNKANKPHEFKLKKALCRYALLLDKLNDEEYRRVFQIYIDDSLAYLSAIYSRAVFEQLMVDDVRSDEEAFLLYMYQAQLCKKNSPKQYLVCLRQGLHVFPCMKRGITLLLKEVQDNKSKEQEELMQYKKRIKSTVEQLIANRKLDDARRIIAEYKTIIPQDLEIILFESQISLLS